MFIERTFEYNACECAFRSRYDAFGEKVKSEGAIANRYLFAGEQFDASLGNYYLRARYYDLSSGVLISRDTWEGELQDPRTLHKYGYAANNPIYYIDPSGNAFMAWFLEAPTIAYATYAAIAVTVYYAAVNSINLSTALSTVASEAMMAASRMSSELIGAASQALAILKDKVNEELRRRKNELGKWQLILQMPSGTTRLPESYTPPIGSNSFIVKQFEGDKMRVLGARLKQRNGPINELIARVDYHPIPREFPNHPYTLHYHLGPNSNSHIHYVLYPENKVV